MTLLRLAGIMGAVIALTAFMVFAHMFLLMWVQGADSITIYINEFREREIEMIILFVGYCLIPITIYKVDMWLRAYLSNDDD